MRGVACADPPCQCRSLLLGVTSVADRTSAIEAMRSWPRRNETRGATSGEYRPCTRPFPPPPCRAHVPDGPACACPRWSIVKRCGIDSRVGPKSRVRSGPPREHGGPERGAHSSYARLRLNNLTMPCGHIPRGPVSSVNAWPPPSPSSVGAELDGVLGRCLWLHVESCLNQRRAIEALAQLLP